MSLSSEKNRGGIEVSFLSYVYPCWWRDKPVNLALLICWLIAILNICSNCLSWDPGVDISQHWEKGGEGRRQENIVEVPGAASTVSLALSWVISCSCELFRLYFNTRCVGRVSYSHKVVLGPALARRRTRPSKRARWDNLATPTILWLEVRVINTQSVRCIPIESGEGCYIFHLDEDTNKANPIVRIDKSHALGDMVSKMR